MDRRPGSDLYYGWVVVAACFLGTFAVFGLSYSFSVFFEQMLEEFDYSRGITSVAFGVQTVTLYIGAVFVGVLVDRYGTRRLMLSGTVLLCLGLVWTSSRRPRAVRSDGSNSGRASAKSKGEKALSIRSVVGSGGSPPFAEPAVTARFRRPLSVAPR